MPKRRPKTLEARYAFERGDRVTCLYPVEAYYSGYAGNPRWYFTPGAEGIVYCISPKVVVKQNAPGADPIYDNKDVRLVVDYCDETSGVTRRVSLNFCNAKKLTPTRNDHDSQSPNSQSN